MLNPHLNMGTGAAEEHVKPLASDTGLSYWSAGQAALLLIQLSDHTFWAMQQMIAQDGVAGSRLWTGPVSAMSIRE